MQLLIKPALRLIAPLFFTLSRFQTACAYYMSSGSVFLRVMVSSLVLVTAVGLALSAGPRPVIGTMTSSLQSILMNTHGSKDYEYPTDITRNILPVSFLFRLMLNVRFVLPLQVALTKKIDSCSLTQVGLSSAMKTPVALKLIYMSTAITGEMSPFGPVCSI